MPEALILGLVLSADSFSAAVAMGFRPYTRRQALQFALSSGLAESLTALLGAWAGSFILQNISEYDHWIAFSLLLAVALHMGKEGWNGLRKGPAPLGEGAPRFHGFAKVLLVSFVTSLDALGVGIGLGVADKPIAPILVSIGLCAFASTMAGLMLARKLSSKFGPVMSLVGALILAVMSLQMLKI